ncbi:hypothetical protein QVD17_34835 [Tagetes erecta]|uniref:Uncharacterized protein n=1 Tax=Tagetes erecta TaxID=13708 RepID=A0AAD8K007_TARER|nr:hypothetical protein QVD17_34835 [Tagetes erecta]
MFPVFHPFSFAFQCSLLFFRHKSSSYTYQIFLSSQPPPLLSSAPTTTTPYHTPTFHWCQMVKFRMMKRPDYPSLLILVMFLILVSSCAIKTKGSSRQVSNTQSYKYVYDSAAVKGFLPKALPVPPSGPSHHHNSIGVNTMHP